MGFPSLRSSLKRSRTVRSTVHLGSTLVQMCLDTPTSNRRRAVQPYELRTDPWGYATEWGTGHLAAITRLLDRLPAREPPAPPDLADASRPRRAVDIGCGEGWVTAVVRRYCDSVLAVDVSPTALRRAEERCRELTGIRFQQWDVTADAPLGVFDVVLALGVLEIFLRPNVQRRARRTTRAMVAPGGHLLVTTTKQADVTERAPWAAPLGRGSHQIARSIERAGFATVSEEETPTHRLTLYREAGAARV